METILVTGGAGFIGSNLVRFLPDRGDCRVVTGPAHRDGRDFPCLSDDVLKSF